MNSTVMVVALCAAVAAPPSFGQEPAKVDAGDERALDRSLPLRDIVKLQLRVAVSINGMPAAEMADLSASLRRKAEIALRRDDLYSDDDSALDALSIAVEATDPPSHGGSLEVQVLKPVIVPDIGVRFLPVWSTGIVFSFGTQVIHGALDDAVESAMDAFTLDWMAAGKGRATEPTSEYWRVLGGQRARAYEAYMNIREPFLAEKQSSVVVFREFDDWLDLVCKGCDPLDALLVSDACLQRAVFQQLAAEGTIALKVRDGRSDELGRLLAKEIALQKQYFIWRETEGPAALERRYHETHPTGPPFGDWDSSGMSVRAFREAMHIDLTIGLSESDESAAEHRLDPDGSAPTVPTEAGSP